MLSKLKLKLNQLLHKEVKSITEEDITMSKKKEEITEEVVEEVKEVETPEIEEDNGPQHTDDFGLDKEEEE